MDRIAAQNMENAQLIAALYPLSPAEIHNFDRPLDATTAGACLMFWNNVTIPTLLNQGRNIGATTTDLARLEDRQSEIAERIANRDPSAWDSTGIKIGLFEQLGIYQQTGKFIFAIAQLLTGDGEQNLRREFEKDFELTQKCAGTTEFAWQRVPANRLLLPAPQSNLMRFLLDHPG